MSDFCDAVITGSGPNDPAAAVYLAREGRILRDSSPIQWAISQPETHIAVFAGPRDFRATTHPATVEFVIEVAVNTLEKDRRKAAIYAAADVAEYWVVDPKTCSILVHRQPIGEGYAEITTSGSGQVVPSSRINGSVIRVDELLQPV